MITMTGALLFGLLALAPSTSASIVERVSLSVEDAPGALELEFQELDSPAGPGSSLPNMVRGADGTVYLTWVDQPSKGETVLRFATFAGDKWGAPREIIRGEKFFTNWADFPSICALENGTLMAHWLRRDDSKHGYNAEFSLSSDGGESWGEPQPLHTDLRPGEHGFVSIAVLDKDTFGAIWLDGRAMVDVPREKAEMNLYFRTISSKGEFGPEQVVDSRVCDCCQTSLVSTGGGQLLAAYRDRDHGEIRDISFATYDGSSWSKTANVHADGWVMPGCPVNGPALAATKDTQAAVWFTGAGKGGGAVLFASRKAGANSFGFPTKLDDGSPVGRVDLIACDGYFLASWMEHLESSFGEWRVLPMGPGGPLGEAVALTRISTGRKAGFLRMAPLEKGCLVAWTSVEGDRPQVVTGRVQ